MPKVPDNQNAAGYFPQDGRSRIGGSVRQGLAGSVKASRRLHAPEYLLQFRNAVDDTEFHVVAQLDLDHFAGETFTHLPDVLRAELQLTAAPFDQVVEQQGREIVNLVVVGMFTTVENLWHGGLDVVALWGYLSPNRRLFHNAPNGGGLP